MAGAVERLTLVAVDSRFACMREEKFGALSKALMLIYRAR
jgi:hypothetical protein